MYLPKALQFLNKISINLHASVFTGVLATFGVQTVRNLVMALRNEWCEFRCWCCGITKADLEKLIEAAKSSGPVQTIKVEHTLKITTDDTYKM